jgi:hypothetical protein
MDASGAKVWGLLPPAVGSVARAPSPPICPSEGYEPVRAEDDRPTLRAPGRRDQRAVLLAAIFFSTH